MTAGHESVLQHIESAHRGLAAQLGVSPNTQFERFTRELRALAGQVAERRTIDDAQRARIMAMGELLATTLGAEFLNAQGIATSWVDARQVLRADDRKNATHTASLLSATCDFAPDSTLQSAWASLDRVVLTQGFIAANSAGDTVFLGRGGSDTSAAYFAAK